MSGAAFAVLDALACLPKPPTAVTFWWRDYPDMAEVFRAWVSQHDQFYLSVGRSTGAVEIVNRSTFATLATFYPRNPVLAEVVQP
jgi:hypothetical protein